VKFNADEIDTGGFSAEFRISKFQNILDGDFFTQIGLLQL